MQAAGFDVTDEVILGARGIFVGRRVLDPTQVYHRRIEKATVAEGSDAYAVPAAAGAGGPDAGPEASRPATATGAAAAPAPDAGAQELELASVRIRQLALESELAQARLQIADLRRPPAAAPGAPGERLQRVVSALRRRAR
jgi:hypothetical protein